VSFAVNWTTTAEAELAQIWLDATDRAAVTSAAFEVDSQLHRDPTRAGESRVRNLRAVIAAPVIYFVVNDASRRVDVTHARSYTIRGR
jgi:hypothetical protein